MRNKRAYPAATKKKNGMKHPFCAPRARACVRACVFVHKFDLHARVCGDICEERGSPLFVPKHLLGIGSITIVDSARRQAKVEASR